MARHTMLAPGQDPTSRVRCSARWWPSRVRTSGQQRAHDLEDDDERQIDDGDAGEEAEHGGPTGTSALPCPAARQVDPEVGDDAAADDDHEDVEDRRKAGQLDGQDALAREPVDEEQDEAADTGDGDTGEYRTHDGRRSV